MASASHSRLSVNVRMRYLMSEPAYRQATYLVSGEGIEFCHTVPQRPITVDDPHLDEKASIIPLTV